VALLTRQYAPLPLFSHCRDEKTIEELNERVRVLTEEKER
jgi:hypothetical protein